MICQVSNELRENRRALFGDAVRMYSKQQDFDGMIERSLETSREVIGSIVAKKGRESRLQDQEEELQYE